MTPEGFHFRDMCMEDVPRIAALEMQCFRSPWSEGSLRDEMRNKLAHYRVLENPEGLVIGYAGMWTFLGESHVTNVAIAPEYRGQGLGRALMKNAMQTALQHKAHTMSLEVRESNTVAQNLYSSLGFTREGLRKHYYSDTGENALVLWNSDIEETLRKEEEK